MRFIPVTFVFILCLGIFTGCKTIEEVGVNIKFPHIEGAKVKHKKGPPPHAPAHGYRHKNQQGVELQFDSGLGVYIVAEMPGIYFHNGLYMQMSDGQWRTSLNINGPWQPEVNGRVPSKLKKIKGKGKSKGKGHGKWK